MKVLLLQTAIGDYRQNVLEEVSRLLGDDFVIRCGSNYFYDSLKTAVSLGDRLKVVDNWFLFGRRVLIQPGVLGDAISCDVIVMELNPRILTNWLIVLIRKVLGKKTVFWGHAWPRAGMQSRSDSLRNLMRRTADYLIVYTESQRREILQKMGGRTKVLAAPNALYRSEEMKAVGSRLSASSFLYVGRLVEEKRPDLLIRAFGLFRADCDDGKLIFVGSGPMLEECKRLVVELKLEACVRFEGHVADVKRLRLFYEESIASVSPGYVGLSITQSFGFGVPMIIADDEPHAPEIEAASEGENAIFFKARDERSLAEALKSFYLDRNIWAGRSQAISDSCRESYSAEVMASRIVEAVNAA